MLGELRIIRKDQQAARIQIQSADGRDERIHIGDQVVHGRASLRILEGRNVTGGLIQQNIDAIARVERLAIEQDAIVREINPHVRVLR
ncbi:MAG TPA: hypothetical protein VG345_01035 [Bryobacteraceae bacterium]|nr:hypothetical protein [Bryobacteraceae bacterium]